MWRFVCCIDEPAPIMLAGDYISRFDDEEARNILEDTLQPTKYDPLEFWNHIQSMVRKRVILLTHRCLSLQ